MSNDHFQSRISLLNEYAQCLQKQNKAKSTEISVLHQHLHRVQTENAFLRAAFDQLRIKLQQKDKIRSVSLSLQTSINFDSKGTLTDTCCQTAPQEQQENTCLDHVDQILALNQRSRQKDDIIANYHKECQDMFDAIQKLEASNKAYLEKNNADRDVMSKMQEKLRKQEQRRAAAQRRLQDASYNIYNAGEQVQNYKRKTSKFQAELQELIIENNGLIQRVRELQREKNEYYHQIKRMSRVSFGNNDTLGKSAVKKSRKVSEQRFREIQEHLRKVQMENEAMQANLMISR